MKSIIVATRNKHKASEIQSFFRQKNILLDVHSLVDVPSLPEIDEDCLSFEGNALKKAKTIALITKQPVLADDSGLVVPALDGRPGVFSARYAGPKATDDENNQKILEEIGDFPDADLAAKFVCSMVLFLPNGNFYTSIGELFGQLIHEYRGTYGFGYDPLFYLKDRNCTLAEVPESEKIQFSHRTKALENLIKIADFQGVI